MNIQAKNYIAGSRILPLERDENGNLTIEFKGARFVGTKEEWFLFIENLNSALKSLE